MQGLSELEIDNPFTRVVFDAVKTMDWESLLEEPKMPDESAPIEKRIEYVLSSFDARLKDYTKSLLLTWAMSRSRRQQTPARTLAKQITQIYLNQIVWERVYRAFIE